MNYTLHQLQVFLKVVQTKSVTKASEQLHLTQPAVSIQLKNFQDQFEIPLTEVLGRRIYITEFGYEIAEAAEAIINQVHAIDHKTLAYKGLLFGRLRLSIVSTGKYVMPYFLYEFMQAHDGVELQMDVTNKNSVIRSLDENEVDFALVSLIPKSLHVEKLDFLQNRLYLVGKDDPRKRKSPMTTEAFKELPLIFREQGSGTREIMERFIDNNKIEVYKKIELTSNEAVKQSLMAGFGFSIMPLIGIKNELRNGELKIIPCKGLPITTTWSLVWNKGKKHSPASRAFLEYLIVEKERIVQEKFNWYEEFK